MRQVKSDDNHRLRGTSPGLRLPDSMRLMGVLVLLLATPVAVAQPARPSRAPVQAASAGTEGGAAALAERQIEKREGARNFRLTLQPGELQVGKVAVVTVEIQRVLDIPDPITGRSRPLQELEPVAELTPSLELRRGRNAPQTVVAKMWPMADPGSYAFHFTPEADGLYTLKISAEEEGEGNTRRPFDVSFRLGIGSASAETEQGTGSAVSRRGGRRPVGPGVRERSRQSQLQQLMEKVGDGYLALKEGVEALPARGAVPKTRRDALAKEARELAELLAQTNGTSPSKSSADEYDALVAEAVLSLEGLATAAEGQSTAAASLAAFEQVQTVGCLKCHAKYRWKVTNDLTEAGWPWPQASAKAE